MERNKQKGGSSSSFTSELFGSKESSISSSSSGIFDSIFSSSSSKVFGRESLRSELSGKTAYETLTSKLDSISKGYGDESQNKKNKDMNPIYEDQRAHPCHLSSSIYYGGQDIFPNPQSTQNEGLNSLFKNDVGVDNPEIASRGNWWQGGLYY